MTAPLPGLYHPGSSVLHRLPAGAKLLGLAVVLVVLGVLRWPWTPLAALLLVAALAALGRIPPRVLLAQVRPLRWLLPVLLALQWWTSDLATGLRVCGSLVAGVALAALVTLTTRVTAMLDLSVRLLRPLRRRVDPDRVALVLALAIRAVPLAVEVLREVREASAARGTGFSLRALGAPVLVRSLRRADALGEALIARGVDD